MTGDISNSAAAALKAAVETRKFSFPYLPIPEALYYWGPVTASINWCEEDYVVTKYIAEFCNTTTNALFIILAALAIRNAFRYGYERRVLFTSMGFMLVGVGSWLFHMTLKYGTFNFNQHMIGIFLREKVRLTRFLRVSIAR